MSLRKAHKSVENKFVDKRSASSNDEDTSASQTSDKEQFELKRNIGLPGSVAILAGTIVGSGIFASPGGVLQGANGSVGLSLVLWAACGVISALAALCYCELASMFNDSGAEYAYLYRGYGRLGPVLAFTFSWTGIFILTPSSGAAKALVFGSYAIEPFYAGDCTPPDAIVKCTAASLIIFVASINYANVKAASKMISVLTVTKFIGMGIIIIGGFVRLAQGDPIGHSNLNNAFKPEDLAGLGFSQIGLALYQGLWSYDGWSNLNTVTEEVKNSKRTVPLAIVIALPLVTLFYLLINIGYFSVLTPAEVMTSDAVAVTFGYKVFGFAGWIMSLVVCVSTFGSLHGTFLSRGRVSFVAARRGQLPQVLGMVTVDFLTPGPAIIFLTMMSLIFLIPNDFSTLVNAFNFTSWLFKSLVIATVIIFRFTLKDHPRPFKVPIVIPVISVIIGIYLVIAPLVENPDIFLLYSAAFVFIGPIVYFVFVHKNLKVPGIDLVTVMLQNVLNVAPTDWKDEMSLSSKEMNVGDVASTSL